jgi:hypothetical protein
VLRWPGRSLPSQRPDETIGAEAMRKLSDIWLIGTQLARRLQVSKTGLYRAAESGELRTSSTACGRLATTLQEAERWLQRNRA